MADIKFAIREMQKQFAKEYYLELFEELEHCQGFGDKVLHLQRVISSNASEWSGGHSATNLEEQMRREAAINLLADVAIKLMHNERKAA
jgi:hypothetical protein